MLATTDNRRHARNSHVMFLIQLKLSVFSQATMLILCWIGHLAYIDVYGSTGRSRSVSSADVVVLCQALGSARA